MNLNTLMHQRNRYKDNPPDFKYLALKYPYFEQYTRENNSSHVTIDFKNPEALRALLYALLEHDFGMALQIPLDRLIPTLPLRLNYIHWIEDLVRCCDDALKRSVIGIDIGTGTSCIYPLLGTKLNGWRFLATEVDELSLRYAQENVQRNGFSDVIQVQLVKPGNYLAKPLEDSDIKTATFCMCNPPFFTSEDEAVLGPSRTDKRSIPISVSTGSTNETVTTGGEVEFVKGIITDSLELGDVVSWYTSMLGKKSSLKEIVAYLKENNVPTVCTTQFCQGKTMRWGVAWSFIPGLSTDQIKSPPSKKRRKENKPLVFTIPQDSPIFSINKDCSRFDQAVQMIEDLMESLKITTNKNACTMSKVCQWQCCATEVTWSNQRRKRRQQKMQSNRSDSSESDQATPHHNILEVTESSLTSTTDNDNYETKDSSSTNSGSNAAVCTFQVCVQNNDQNELEVQVQCISAENKNNVYQFYQFLHNKVVKGL